MYRITILLTLSLFHFSVYSQSDDIIAKSAFLSAQDAYGNGDYTTAIDKLEHVKELLGSTNPRVEQLLTNAHFEIGDYEKAQSSLESYFELAADSDPNYMQMVRLVDQIKVKQAELAEKEFLVSKDESAWKEAREQNTPISYDQYLESFPKGKYNKEAIENRNKVAFNQALAGTLDIEYYLSAIVYALENKTNLNEALEWLDVYLSDEQRSKNFHVVHLKAKVHHALGNTKEAIKTAELSKKLATENRAGDFGYVKRNEDLINLIKSEK